MLGKTNVNFGGKLDNGNPLIHINAPSGSRIDIYKNSVLIQSIPSTEAFVNADNTTQDYFYSGEVGTYEVRAQGPIDVDQKNVTVNATAIKQYDVTITYGVHLYRNGNQYSSITGGWGRLSSGNGQDNRGTVTINSTNIYISGSYVGGSYFGYCGMGCVNKINLSGYSKLKIKATTSSPGTVKMQMGVNSSWRYQPIPAYYTDAIVTLGTGTNVITTLNISSINAQKWIGVGTTGGSSNSTATSTIYDIWLEV